MKPVKVIELCQVVYTIDGKRYTTTAKGMRKAKAALMVQAARLGKYA
jgi:hypothetical protein